MADVSGTGDAGQSFGREAGARAGLAVLSRFLGAVFLVLLGGLLLLDRALLRANLNQATLDAQSAGLLTESFIAARSDVLDRVAQLAAVHSDVKNSALLHQSVSALLSRSPGARHVWVRNAAGELIMDFDTEAAVRPIPPRSPRWTPLKPRV